MSTYLPQKKAFQVFGLDTSSVSAKLPPFSKNGNRQLKSWSLDDLPSVGEKIGFLDKLTEPTAASIFVTKGGVLKTSLTLNIARMAALHNIRTCVVGLDMQGDVSNALGNDVIADDESSFEDALEKMDSLQGLADLYAGSVSLDEIICATDIPTLSYIPETPELVSLDQSLIHRNRREFWLKDCVITPLKKKFDLILMDGSPNWNRLITNALVASDILISPLECKINNFRNFKTFKMLLSEFREEMQLDFKQVYVPTRLAPNRRLSREIFDWYQANLEQCLSQPLKESSAGEESIALRQSIPEYSPTSAAAVEMRRLLEEIWDTMPLVSSDLRKTASELRSQKMHVEQGSQDVSWS